MTIIDLFLTSVVGRDTFSPQALVVGPQQKTGRLCHALPQFMAVSTVRREVCGIIKVPTIVCGIRGGYHLWRQAYQLEAVLLCLR